VSLQEARAKLEAVDAFLVLSLLFSETKSFFFLFAALRWFSRAGESERKKKGRLGVVIL
jgi:hypothetical protein